MVRYLIISPDCSACHIYQQVEQGSFFDRKRSPLDENSFWRIGRSSFVDIISKIVVITGILMLFHMGSRCAWIFPEARKETL